MTMESIHIWMLEFGADLGCMLISILMLLGYYARHHKRVKLNPSYSIHVVNKLARRIWVKNIMENSGKELVAVQTLRNYIMYPILMVSTAALLIIGTLTLSGQVDKISMSWHAANIVGSHASSLWMIKVMLLLADFLVAFFAYALSIRLANHVLFMLNIPMDAQAEHQVLSPEHVANRLNQSGYLISIGIRAFMFAIPLVFWLFGPLYLALSTAGVIVILSYIDRHDSGY
ncbi:MAG: DUF599 domain-containing protein [Gallionellaceae bacterium]|jgi:uncharacterized membrane protein